MKTEYKINFNETSIIGDQLDYNLQEGGFEEMTSNKIIELWQNPDYDRTSINFYSLVNKYLRGIEIIVKSEWLVALQLQSKKDFYDFLIYYVNKLTNIIYKKISVEKKIFYRGENRKSFNYSVGDILYYPTFQSVSASISTAYKFSESTTDTKLLFMIEIPAGFHYKALYTQLKTHNYKEKITQIIDEKEYIIMPNSYYTIVEKSKIYGDVNLVKIRLCEQKYYQIVNSKLYEPEELTLKNEQIKRFSSKELIKFINKSIKYQKMINTLVLMKNYQINRIYYDELNDLNFSNMFDLDIVSINQIKEQITNYNIKEKAEELKRLGVNYYDYQLRNVSKYKERLDTLNIIINADFKRTEKLTVYAGFHNVNSHFKKQEFIEFIKNKKIDEEFEYTKIFRTNLEPNKFLYDDIYNSDYPHKKIKKNNKTKLVYYKYLIKFDLKNIKICVCSTHYFEKYNNIILIPKYKMKVTEKNKKHNKYNLPYTLYKIDLFDY